MAEQIRSFWSHLCGIFGAIFGMIAGGTLVTIERAEAVSTYYANQTLSNGAVVSYFYGRNYTPYYVYYGGSGPCLKSCGSSTYGCDHYYRYYVTFLRCADGYYSTGLVNEGKRVTVPVSSGTSTLGTAALVGSLTDRGLCSTYRLCGNSTMSDAGCSGYFYSPFNGQYMAYDAGPETQTAGFCNKCPDYGTYAAATTSSIGKGNITSCFMSPDTEYSDESDQADGVATGKFIWTNSCFYEDDTNPGLTPYCDALAAEGNDEHCILYLTAVATSAGLVETTTQIVGNIYGGNSNTANSKVQYVLNNNKETLIRNAMSCSAANCYKNALENLGGSSARIEYYYE